MNNHTDAVYIRQWVELIETRWQRGPSREWKSYDFEKLSEEIFEATGAALSISTLKRIFGKVSYNNIPSVFTLNTLARFAGFEDWNAFKRRVPVSMSTQDVRVVPGTDRTIAGLKKNHLVASPNYTGSCTGLPLYQLNETTAPGVR